MATRTKVPHLSVDERRALGKEARNRTPPSSHTGWAAAADRPDPVALLEEQNLTREPDLVPVRHGRMMVSPFTFYRGAAKIMAADLAATPTAGLTVQLCGDAHLSNFGAFASPERRLLFDLNDFDETLPGAVRVRRQADGGQLHHRGPQQRLWQGRHPGGDAGVGGGLPGGDGRLRPDGHDGHLVRPPGRGRAHERGPSAPPPRPRRPRSKEAKAVKRAREDAREKNAAKAHTRDSLQALSKLGELVDGQYRIVSQPPIVVPARDLEATYGLSADQIEQGAPRAVPRLPGHPAATTGATCWSGSSSSTWPARWSGSAASAPGRSSCLLQGRDQQDPLFLQVKEATRSVLEDHLPKSRYQQPRPAGGARPADDAGGQRHLPGLDQGA